MQCQLIAWDLVLFHRVDEQLFELAGALRVLDAPANNAAAEDVEDDIEIEVGPFHRAPQLGNIPRPNLIRGFGQQFRLLIDGVCALSAALGHFALSGQYAIHRADRTQVGPLI